MGSPDLFFFDQCGSTRKVPRRYRKLPEDLPESLRFAHLNPKVAALLASKEHSKHKLDNEDPFGDGLGKKSLLPDINSAFQNVRNQFDSALSNDEDSQRYLFEEAKMTAHNVLDQLSRIIYYYEDLFKHIPKSLEYQLMNGFTELTNDITIVPREWQTQEMKEQHAAKMQQEPNSDEEYSDTEALTGRTKSRYGISERSGSETGGKQNTKKTKSKLGAIDGNDEIEINILKSESRAGRRSESRLSATGSQLRQQLDITNLSRVGSRRKGSSIGSHRSISGMSPATQFKGRDNYFSFINETPSDARSTALANPLSYMQTINFQLSNKQFEDKGWIMLKGREEEVDQSAILDYCIKVLQDSLKQIDEEKKKELDQGFDKPVIVRYYGDTKKETLLKYRKSPVKPNTSPLIKGGKPRIPTIGDERNEGKKLMQAAHIDGTTFVYYPSGRPAVMHSAAGFGRPGFYTIAYEDGLDSRMLACFTPSGRGVCYYDNGVVRFLATEKGGHLAELDGALIRKWKWPQSSMKTTEPINFQINNHLSLRCVSQSQMMLVFSCQRESARFSISPVPDAEEYKGTEETDHLLTAFTFSSKAAKDLMRIFNPNKKSKKKNKKDKSRSQTSEIIKLLADFPDKVTYELEADKELARLQRKARNLVDDWMEHYRIAVGLKSPSLQMVKDSPNYNIHMRNIKSARLSEQQKLIRKAVMGVDDYEEMTSARRARITSAPLAGLCKQFDEDGDERSGSPERHGVTFDDHKAGAASGDGAASPTAIAVMTRLVESAGQRSARSARSARVSTSARSSPCRQSGTLPGQEAQPQGASGPGNRSHCPLVIRQQHLGYERPQCRCSRHHIPFIMDIELDDFVATETPEGQLIVIMVVSSLFPGVTQAEEMLNEIYVNQNRNRTRPCVQSRSDMFRVFKYDINSAAEMSDHTQPLLLTRHNVVPGMILIYCDGKLLFCDHIFNGYGNTRKDFKKQIMKSRHDSIQGFSLPKDFRFSPSKGKSGWRSAWGGEIGGAGIDKYSSTGTVLDMSLQPIHRPSSSNSSEHGREVHLDTVNATKVDLGPFHQEIKVRLKPLVSSRGRAKRSPSRRPFLPPLNSQIGASGPSHESVQHWASTHNHQQPVLSHASSYATSLNTSSLHTTSFTSTAINTSSISGTF